MFRFVALFALVAVAAAEPQWGYPYMGVHNAAHLKTASGDTVSVQAAKVQHHQLKAAEYAKKAYVPYTYASNVVAAPVASAVYSAPATYAAATVPVTYAAATVPAYTHGVYNIHHLGKREAEADSQYVYHANTYAGYPYSSVYNNVYNTAGVYGANIYNTAGVYGTYPYSTYGYAHHLGKRDADADSQWYSTAAGYPVYNNVYNTAGVYGANIYNTAGVYGRNIYNTAGVYGRNVYNNVYGPWY